MRQFGLLIGRRDVAEFVRVASVSDIQPGTAREVTVRDRVLAIFNVDGKFHVLDGICPHAGGPLGEGKLQGNIMTCPWHGWQFDVTSGHHCLTPQICQQAFVCCEEGDDLLVEIPDT